MSLLPRAGGSFVCQGEVMDQHQILKTYFGHTQFRPGQEELVERILAGGDVLGIMPTGAGKSVCYQVPAMLLPGITLVVSPLISLMKDQVRALIQAGVPAAYLNSSLTPRQYALALERMLQGAYRIVYVTPERLETDEFLRRIVLLQVSMVAVDEAHCVSQWGQDFRPSYLRIANFIRQLQPRPVVGAFTATATEQVRQDIIRLLGLETPLCITTGFDRPNLFFAVRHTRDKMGSLLEELQQQPGRSGIVYCATRKAVEEVCQTLRLRGIGATRYHAGLDDRERHANQDDFLYDRCPVMVATNAFGMGIDKSNVSFVIHYQMPKSLESYYQEAGRAGRDGSDAVCVLLFSRKDVQLNRYLIEHDEDNPELDAAQLEAVRRQDLERLRRMTDYATTSSCLRRYLLAYFGQKLKGDCGHCSNCCDTGRWEDMTPAALIALRMVRAASGRCGAAAIADALRGSRSRRVLELGLDACDGYGELKRLPAERVRQLLDELQHRQLLDSDGLTYPVLCLTEAGEDILQQPQPEMILLRSRQAAAARRRVAVSEGESSLYEDLRALRQEMARQAGIPAYLIFSDATLRQMSNLKPQTEEEFLEVPGVGQWKLKHYGAAFLACIRAGGGPVKVVAVRDK